MAGRYNVYILTNKNNTTLYTGVTNDLRRRVLQHRAGEGGWFTKKYALGKLVYFVETSDVRTAIAREKQIKAGSRGEKERLIEGRNPAWEDLAEG
jgi:putative endonuclease